jgi:hypothetical protein
MLHKEPGEGIKIKPRGRPFAKGNKRGKPDNEILDSTGHESGAEGGAVILEHEDFVTLSCAPGLVVASEEATHNESIDIQKEEMETIPQENLKDLKLIESIDFINGNNKLSIKFSKKHNRMYRIQIFLNDDHEVRPVTYSGASTGTTFWNLLKGILRK